MAASLEHGKSLKRHEYQVCQEQQFIIYLFIYQLDFYSVSIGIWQMWMIVLPF